MAAPLFACLVPGRPIVTEFTPIDNQKLICTLPQPMQITQFAISLLRPEIPPGMGVGIFYASAQGDWAYVGQVSIENPTQFFRAPWASGDPQLSAPGASVMIGLMLESEAKLKEYVTSDQVLESKTVDSVRGIAKDLYKFIASFSQDPRKVKPSSECLVVPAKVIDKWLAKFEDKHLKKPFFWMEQRD